MSDERFEAWLKDAVREYNRPPDIAPREEMWDYIEARVQRPESRDSNLGRVAPIGAWRHAPGTRMWTLAAAASLLLAAGIGLGYWARGGTASPPAMAADSGGPSPSVAQAPPALGAQRSPLESPPSALGARRSALSNSASPLDSNDETIGAPTGYDVLATQTLTAAEALLVSFRASDDTAFDDLMRRWSRELLSTTRLLLESPAAGNVERKRLLEDLELVLVQLAQLPADDAALDRELVKRTLSRRQVLTRIRTSIPAGQSSGS